MIIIQLFKAGRLGFILGFILAFFFLASCALKPNKPQPPAAAANAQEKQQANGEAGAPRQETQETSSKTQTAAKESPTEGKESSARKYGAIAYSPKTKKWRMRWNVMSQQRAIHLVLTECGEADCQTILAFGPNTCGNFSLGSNNAVGAGAGLTESEATQAALDSCLAAGANCKTAAPRCNQ